MPGPYATKKQENQIWREALQTLLPHLSEEAAQEWGATPQDLHNLRRERNGSDSTAHPRRAALSGYSQEESGSQKAISRSFLQNNGLRSTPNAANSTSVTKPSSQSNWLTRQWNKTLDAHQAEKPKKYTPARDGLVGDCSYYTTRAIEYYTRTGKEPPEYFLGKGYNRCENLKKVKNKLTPVGQQCVDNTIRYFQEYLEEDFEKNPLLANDKEALDSAVYTARKNALWSAGFYNMPFSDRKNVFDVVGYKLAWGLLLPTLVESAQRAPSVVKHGTKQVGEVLSELSKADTKRNSIKSQNIPDNLTFTPAPKERMGSCSYYTVRSSMFTSKTDEEPPSYYINYGHKYCERFTRLKQKLTPTGLEFVDKAKLYLQEYIEEELEKNPALEYDDEAFTDMAFNTHVQAYLAAGFYELPISDRTVVATALDPKEWAKLATLKQAAAMVPNLIIESTRRLPGVIKHHAEEQFR